MNAILSFEKSISTGIQGVMVFRVGGVLDWLPIASNGGVKY
jgi:hypothetical protein